MNPEHMMQKLQEVDRVGKKARGRVWLIRYLDGERLTRQQSIDAHCYDCCGYAMDGRPVCDLETCPLWPYSPFRPGPGEG